MRDLNIRKPKGKRKVFDKSFKKEEKQDMKIESILNAQEITELAKERFKEKFGRSPKVYDVVISDGSRKLI